MAYYPPFTIKRYDPTNIRSTPKIFSQHTASPKIAKVTTNPAITNKALPRNHAKKKDGAVVNHIPQIYIINIDATSPNHITLELSAHSKLS
jgi:hypothetical protein